MAEAYFNTQFSAYTNPVRLQWYLQSNPNALVGSENLPFPNLDGEETLITGLQSKLYRFEFWELVSGTPTFLIGKPIYMKPTGQKVAVTLYHYTVGGPESWDPAAGQDTLTDSRLNGKTFHVSQRVNDWRQPSDYAAIPGGGFQLLTGEEFKLNDQWTVMVIDTVDQASSGGGDGYDLHEVETNETFDEEYQNMENVAIASFSMVTMFPSFGSIPDCKAKFSTYGLGGLYWHLQFNTGDTVKFLGEEVNFIVLRQDECLELRWKNGKCYIVSFPHPKAELAGEPVLAIKKLRATEYANGQEKDIDAYQDLIARLPANMKVTYAQWAETENVTIGGVITTYQKNRAKFAVDTTAGKFKFPDLRDLNFKALKHVDGSTDASLLSQGAGGLSPQDLLPHGHNVATTGNQSGVNPGKSLQRSSTNAGGGENDDPGAGSTPYIRTSGGTKQMIESSNYLPLIRI